MRLELFSRLDTTACIREAAARQLRASVLIMRTNGLNVKLIAAYIAIWMSKWRRGESNPRPETSAVPASTCLVGVLISIRAAIADILRAAPAVLISSLHQRPNEETSLLFLSRRVADSPRRAERP